MMGKKASRGAPHTQLWEDLSTQLPEQLTYEIFTLASTLRPQKLDCSDVPLLGKIPSDDDLASWTSDARERSKWDRDAPGFDERCAMAEVQLRTLPSLSRPCSTRRDYTENILALFPRKRTSAPDILGRNYPGGCTRS